MLYQDHAHPPIPMTLDGILDHMVTDHGQHFMTTGAPPLDVDVALEYQLEYHDRLHATLTRVPHPILGGLVYDSGPGGTHLVWPRLEELPR